MFNLADPYVANQYTGILGNFINYNSPFPSKISSVEADISGQHLLDKTLVNELLNENAITFSLIISPKDAILGSNTHLLDIEKHLANPKVEVVGLTGLDRFQNSSLSNQTPIFITMMKIAKKTKRPTRIYFKGYHSKVIGLMREHLEKEHKIHYTNFDMTLREFMDFLINFPNSYIGISKLALDNRNMGFEILQCIPLTK